MWLVYETQSLAWKVLNMPQLRHIHTKSFGLFIPLPTSLIAKRENHLQTLTGLTPSSCNDKVLLQRLPNLKKLGILLINDSVVIEKCYCLDNLVHLRHLEKLKVKFKEKYLRPIRWMRTDKADPISPRLHIPHCDNFPPILKKLTLCRTNLQWEDMYFLRKLPNLEVLKIKHHAFYGQIWKLNDEDEDGFLKLKFLLLESIHLEQWEATSYHFPSLEQVIITDCYSLEKIPFDFAEIQTLQVIELHKCMLSVLVSAEQIQEEQRSLGNNDLVIRVNYIHEKIS